MKTFKYEKGHINGKTLTVAEFKEKLNEYPNEMPVVTTWEGIHTFINPEDFETKEYCSGFESDKELCLIIDVDQ